MFRIYDKETWKWATPTNDSFDGYEAVICLDGRVGLSRYDDLEILDPKRYVVQAFSGKLDIENKEIYEGDLVELHLAANDHCPENKEACGLYEIFYNNCAFRLREIKHNWFFTGIIGGMTLGDFNAPGVCEVVGNIFENPELLKT